MSNQVTQISSDLPTDDVIETTIKALVLDVDIEKTGVKTFLKLLSEKMGVNLKPKKAFVKEILTDIINKMNAEEEQASGSEESDDDEEEVSKPTKRGKGSGGLAQKKEISAKLATFLGKGATMSRTDIVKYLWEYIK
jgi:chromatin remodeling complex protein RSC6